MIYLDNSATSYPKPECVISAVNNAFIKYGGNSGRGIYKMAMDTTEQIFLCRKRIANFFGVPSEENVVFTCNCTTALNMAIKGLANKNSHFIISDLEHNAVLRPLEKLKKQCFLDYSIASIEKDVYKTINNFKSKIQDSTVAIICTGASNVFGIIPPYKELARLAHKNGLLFVMDIAQIAGVIPINMMRDEIDIMCCAGHKGLMGPTGTGLLLLNTDVNLNTILEGGTGSNSIDANQPVYMPDKFESGTPNVQGIIGLSEAIKFIEKKKIENIYMHEFCLIKYLYSKLSKCGNIFLYNNFCDKKEKLAPILSFNIKNMHSEQVAQLLAEDGIAVRAGLHCAPLAHKKFKTENFGAVRVSPSIFTQKNDIDFLINSVRKIAKSK